MSNPDEQKQDEDTPKVNTDRELYREPSESEGMSYYANSIHVTKEGSIGMDVGGYVIVMPIAEWHNLAKQQEASPSDSLSRMEKNDE